VLNKTILLSILLVAATGFAGCTHKSNVADNFGNAYREAVARSTDDPEGSAANADKPGPMGADGVSAAQSTGRYRAGFEPDSGGQLPLPMIVTDDASLGGY
jgi:hypothetical protein